MAIAAVLLHISSSCAAIAVISVRLTIAVPISYLVIDDWGFSTAQLFQSLPSSCLPLQLLSSFLRLLLLQILNLNMLVKTGDIFEHSKVIRVDRGLGLLLEIAASPDPTPAFVGVSDVADKEVKKLEKNFKEGSRVRVRILGFRHLEGLATGVLKSSAFEGSVFTHSDMRPGMAVKAKVITIDNFGAIVQFPSGVKALCPLRHMSEFEIAKPRKKFQVGADLLFRVLGYKSKRITVTHKKTLIRARARIRW